MRPLPVRRALGRAILLAAALGAPAAARGQDGGSAQPGARPRVTLLVSIDGLRPDYVLRADSLRLEIPHLRRLAARGSHATGVVGVLPTVTYPSHATLLTGVAPARHGVYGNTTFDPLARNHGGWYWYAADVRVPTLWDAAAAAGLATANVHWPVSVGARVTHNLPQYWRAGTPDDRKLLRALATPGLVDRLERDLGPYADGIDESIEGDETRARFAERLLERERPAFMTAYFTALDHEQHVAGPFTPEAFAVLERVDAIVGRLVAAAERAGGGSALVAVVSDHGFVPVDRQVNLLSAFRAAGLVRFERDTSSRPSDWKATVWPNGALAAVMLRDPADSATARRARALLDSLARDPLNGIERVIDAAALRATGGFPGAAFMIALRRGYTVGALTSGPLVTSSASYRGMHGYPPDLPDMRAAFLVAGPGVPAGRSLGVIDMRDVAPTLAALMRVDLPRAEGRDVLGRAASRSDASR